MPTSRIEVAPSILSADFRCLEREVKTAQDAGADRIHCDVMDGHFVPNLTFGPLVVDAVRNCVDIPLDVHLMISEPQRYLANFCDAGADIVIVHLETCPDPTEAIDTIKKRRVRAGLCVNPDADLSLLLPHLDKIDQVLIMTVFAGFGGQEFMADMLPRIRQVWDSAREKKMTFDIEVDGGITDETARLCAENGANVFVAGNYVFNGGDYRDRIQSIRRGAEAGQQRLP